MGTFKTKTILHANPDLIPTISSRICEVFASEGYDTKKDSLLSGGIEVFLSKGGMFKEIVGMRTALVVTLIPTANTISFEAGIGIFGQQFLPTIISMLFAWPVLLTQMWGLVQQSKLDDKALKIANEVIAENDAHLYKDTMSSTVRFCTKCGTKQPANAKFCPNCGNQLE